MTQILSTQTQAHSEIKRVDVLVVGGGPAGSTIATLLAKKGWQVVLVEKEHHPRFHIGESLLPMNMPILEELGVLQQVHQIGMLKTGAEFISNEGKSRTYYFKHALNKHHPSAYEVRRSEFDELLFRNSQKHGVDTQEGMKVIDINHQSESINLVTVKDLNGQQHLWQARFVIDASGRDSLYAKKCKLQTRNRQHNNAAIYGHFMNVPRRSGEDEGNISIYWFPQGWIWMIPLKDQTMSVGAVCRPAYLKTRTGTLETFFHQTLSLNPDVHLRMQQAEPASPVNATANYSYRSKQVYTENCLMIGDAYTFIDPVFSSGVYIAMKSASMATEVVDTYLNNSSNFEMKLNQYETRLRKGLKKITWFIYRFNTPGIYWLFNNPNNIFRVQEAVISMLSGDVFNNKKIRKPLIMFHLFYYLSSLRHFSASFSAYLKRKQNVRVKIQT